MSTKRQRRVADLIHQEISNALQFEIKDPRIGFITITGATVTSDLTLATIYISVFEEDTKAIREVFKGLESSTPYLKRLIGQNLKLRTVPELTFKVDQSLAHAQRIETLLAEIDIPPEDTVDPDSETQANQSL